MNKHTAVKFKRELDALIKDSERLAFLLDALENKEYGLITRCDDGAGHRTICFEEIESILNGV
jgi:hypothetical protein